MARTDISYHKTILTYLAFSLATLVSPLCGAAAAAGAGGAVTKRVSLKRFLHKLVVTSSIDGAPQTVSVDDVTLEHADISDLLKSTIREGSYDEEVTLEGMTGTQLLDRLHAEQTKQTVVLTCRRNTFVLNASILQHASKLALDDRTGDGESYSVKDFSPLELNGFVLLMRFFGVVTYAKNYVDPSERARFIIDNAEKFSGKFSGVLEESCREVGLEDPKDGLRKVLFDHCIDADRPLSRVSYLAREAVKPDLTPQKVRTGGGRGRETERDMAARGELAYPAPEVTRQTINALVDTKESGELAFDWRDSARGRWKKGWPAVQMNVRGNESVDEQTNVLDLAGRGLTTSGLSGIDRIANLDKVTLLDLSDNRIGSLTPEFMAHFPELREVILSRNPMLSDLPIGLFNEDQAIVFFECRECNLVSFSSDIFADKDSLLYVDVSKNAIRFFPIDLNLCEELNQFKIADNRICTLEAKLFVQEDKVTPQIPSLKTLVLDGNNLDEDCLDRIKEALVVSLHSLSLVGIRINALVREFFDKAQSDGEAASKVAAAEFDRARDAGDDEATTSREDEATGAEYCTVRNYFTYDV